MPTPETPVSEEETLEVCQLHPDHDERDGLFGRPRSAPGEWGVSKEAQALGGLWGPSGDPPAFLPPAR